MGSERDLRWGNSARRDLIQVGQGRPEELAISYHRCQ
jgi:hypothetical protein